jgi:hypothetical protein
MSPTPPAGWQGHDGPVFGDEWCPETQPSLDRGQLGQRPAGRENQVDERGYPSHIVRRDCQAILGIE